MSDFIEVGKQKGYIQILDGGTRIHYIVPDKKYKFSDPEEKVRARILCRANRVVSISRNVALTLEVDGSTTNTLRFR